MANEDSSSRITVTEPVPVFETFTTGVASVDNCGDFRRVTFFVDRPLVGTSVMERAVIARLIVPSGIYADMVDALAAGAFDPDHLAVAS